MSIRKAKYQNWQEYKKEIIDNKISGKTRTWTQNMKGWEILEEH